MLGAVAYAAANSAVRAGVTRLLSPEDWIRVLAAGDLGAALHALQATHYGRVVLNAGEELSQTENALQSLLAEAALLPAKFLRGYSRDLIVWLWRRTELENLTTTLRGVHGGVPAEEIRRSLVPLGNRSDLPWDRLSGAGSVSAVVDSLRSIPHGRFYAQALEQAIHGYEHQGNVFLLEIALQRAYYRRLHKLVESLSGRDRKDAELFVGTIVDSRNLVWAYRYRLYFHMGPEDVLSFTLPHGFRVDSAVVRRIAEGANLVAVLQSVWDGRLQGIERLSGLSPRESLIQVDMILRRYRHSLATRAMVGYPFHLAVILAYLILLEDEVSDVTTVLEGKAAGRPVAWIRRNLVGQRAVAA